MAQRRLSDLLDFLKDTPYLPLAARDEELYFLQAIPTKSSIHRILRSRRIRTILTFVFITAIIYFWPSIPNFDILGRFTGPTCLRSPAITPPLPYLGDGIEWSRYAYAQYVTNTEYLCNSVMIFETLDRLGSKPDRLMMYPSSFLHEAKEDSVEIRLLLKAKNDYGVKLMPIEVQHRKNTFCMPLPPHSHPAANTHRSLGRKLYQASSLQPNSIRTASSPRLRFHNSPIHG